jgi:Skp family chaperone for outer membrane proteins
MKRFIALILVLGGFVVSLSAQGSITRFGMVDMNRVVALYTDKEAQEAYDEKLAIVQAEIDRRTGELHELNDQLEEAKEQKNPRRQIRKLEEDIAQMTETTKTYVDTMTAELERDRNDLLKKINIRAINDAIRYVAEREGISMVLAKGDKLLAWASPKIDITTDVINRLRGGR